MNAKVMGMAAEHNGMSRLTEYIQFLFQFGRKCLPGEDLAGINFHKVREE